MKIAGASPACPLRGPLALTFTVAAQSPQHIAGRRRQRNVPRTPRTQAADALIAAARRPSTSPRSATSSGRRPRPGGHRRRGAGQEPADEFAARARERQDVAVDPTNPNRATLSVGADLWPLPIPIVKHAGAGHSTPRPDATRSSIDASAATSSTPSRSAAAIVEAQHEYALTKHDESTVNRVRPARHQHAGQAGRPRVAEQPMDRGPARSAKPSHARSSRVCRSDRAVPRLPLQGPDRARPGGAAR